MRGGNRGLCNFSIFGGGIPVPVLRAFCGDRLASCNLRSGLHGTNHNGRYRTLRHALACRHSHNRNVSTCVINPALNTNIPTLVRNGRFVFPLYCGGTRILSVNPLHFAIHVAFNRDGINTSRGIIRAHIVALSGNARLGGYRIACSGLDTPHGMTTNIIMRGDRPGTCTVGGGMNCITCTSTVSRPRTVGNRVCVTYIFPKGLGTIGCVPVNRRTTNTINRIMNVDRCGPNRAFACCFNAT